MRIAELYIRGDKKRIRVERMILEEGLGIVGNAKGKNKERQISILSWADRRAMEKMHEPGLCTRRFQENMTIHGLKAEKFCPGDQVKIGNALILITKIEKRCFPDCPLVRTKDLCPLTKGVIYAKVVKGGEIRLREKLCKI